MAPKASNGRCETKFFSLESRIHVQCTSQFQFEFQFQQPENLKHLHLHLDRYRLGSNQQFLRRWIDPEAAPCSKPGNWYGLSGNMRLESDPACRVHGARMFEASEHSERIPGKKQKGSSWSGGFRPLFYFGWPSEYGGADTKAAHLLKLLAGFADITVIPNCAGQLQDPVWTTRLDALGIRYSTLASLPSRLDGVALAMCNNRFFSDGIYSEALQRGLQIVWSSEMMWHHPWERELIEAGVVTRLLYVSDIQRKALNYESFCNVPTRMTGNYISVDDFPFVERPPADHVTIGRLSRADALKYPEDFPVFYEALDIPNSRFRVMAWSDELSTKYRWHHFDDRWDLLPPEAEPAYRFLQSLDLFVYPLGHQFTESWGRSTVEAMLTGAIPIVPAGHHFESLIEHGKSGFLCDDFRDYHAFAQGLANDTQARRRMSLACRQRAEELNDPDKHRAIWMDALNV